MGWLPSEPAVRTSLVRKAECSVSIDGVEPVLGLQRVRSHLGRARGLSTVELHQSMQRRGVAEINAISFLTMLDFSGTSPMRTVEGGLRAAVLLVRLAHPIPRLHRGKRVGYKVSYLQYLTREL